MGKKKKKVQEDKPWCWYCDREFDDEKILIQHQKAKHFKCHICHRKLNTASGMVIHAMQVHKERLTQVYNAKPGRESVDIEIFGMEGIPEEDLKAKAIERGMGEPDAKKAKVETPPPAQSFLVAPAPHGFGAPAVPPGVPGMPPMMHGFPPGFPQPPPGMPPPGFPPPQFPVAPPGMPPPGFMPPPGMFPPQANGMPPPGFPPGFMPPPGMGPPPGVPPPPTQAQYLQGATASAPPTTSPAPPPAAPQAAFPAYSQPQTSQPQTLTPPPSTGALTPTTNAANSNPAPSAPPAPEPPAFNHRQQNADGSTLVFNHPSKCIEELRAEFPHYRYVRA